MRWLSVAWTGTTLFYCIGIDVNGAVSKVHYSIFRQAGTSPDVTKTSIRPSNNAGRGGDPHSSLVVYHCKLPIFTRTSKGLYENYRPVSSAR